MTDRVISDDPRRSRSQCAQASGLREQEHGVPQILPALNCLYAAGLGLPFRKTGTFASSEYARKVSGTLRVVGDASQRRGRSAANEYAAKVVVMLSPSESGARPGRRRRCSAVIMERGENCQENLAKYPGEESK